MALMGRGLEEMECQDESTLLTVWLSLCVMRDYEIDESVDFGEDSPDQIQN